MTLERSCIKNSLGTMSKLGPGLFCFTYTGGRGYFYKDLKREIESDFSDLK